MIQAIETFYGGRKYRSRTEARWALYFDTIGAEFDYELEGVKTSSGRWYLCDFYLRNVTCRGGTPPGVWFEVKPPTESNEQAEAVLIDLSNQSSKPSFIAYGPPDRECRVDHIFQIWPYWDNYMTFMKCYKCGAVKLEYGMEGGYQTCATCSSVSDNEHPDIQAAMEAVLTERFDGGVR